MHMQDRLTIRSPRRRHTRHESGIAGRTPANTADGQNREMEPESASRDATCEWGYPRALWSPASRDSTGAGLTTGK
jgi:hypothetical protein